MDLVDLLNSIERLGIMQEIDETRLETDVGYRFQYLSHFLEFDQDDIAAIHGLARWMEPLVPDLVDAVYEKLFAYTATKRHFAVRPSNYEGEVPQDTEALKLEDELIRFRKQHLSHYLEALLTKPFGAKMAQYLDMVGKMHTSRGGSPKLSIPLVQMNALLAFVADAITDAIFGFGLDRETEVRTVRAFNKLIWLQNDLVNRHYAA
jgi:hypothetical protein